MRGGQRWTRSARATHEVRLLDYMNTSNMNKYTQRDGRGTTNFILVARAEGLGEARSRTVKRAPRPTKGAGARGAAAASDAKTTPTAWHGEVDALGRRAWRGVELRGKRKLQPLCAASCKPTVKGADGWASASVVAAKGATTQDS